MSKDGKGNLLPEFDLISFERIMGRTRGETSGEIRAHAQQLRLTAYKEITCAIIAMTMAIFVIVMNRLGYPIIGIR